MFVGLVEAQLKTLPRGGNRKASVTEEIGITDVTIHYSRPGVKKREGHIWGELIPVGFYELGYGAKKPAPWRAGANENTTIEFSTDVKIDGQSLQAGKYGFFVAYGPEECTLIFSKNARSWGNFFYNPDEDALRIKVAPVKLEKSVEWLKYEFTDQTPDGATVQLQWEHKMIPFTVKVDVVGTQIASFREELRGDKALPGSWQVWNQAAAFCVAHNTNLDEALMWADSSLSFVFGGGSNFNAWETKAEILDSMGRKAEAAEIMKKALPLADHLQGYTYGMALITANQPRQAFEVMQYIYQKYPNTLFTNIGMASGYSALGDYKKALPFAEKALAQAKGGNKILITQSVKDLQAGKDMNN
jgi:Protein of unknown function (DUF2911)/Tetratricopeptide repeat